MTETQAAGRELDRSEIDPRYTWDLTDLYDGEDAWRAERSRIVAELGRISEYEGRLHESAATLADALDTVFSLQKELSRLRLYAQLLHDEDTRDARHQALVRSTVPLATEFGTRASFLRPEIVRIGEDRIREFIAREPRLEPYTFLLEDVLRRAAHTLPEPEERILAAAAPLAGSPRETFDVLSNADFPYPTITLSDGRRARITPATYTDLRTSPDRADRRLVMSAFFEALGEFGGTFGTILNGSVQKALFFARSRGFASTLEATLFGPNIPVSVYTGLIDGVNRHLPTLHRYLDLRRRVLGLEDLHYHDLYAPLVASDGARYSPEDARELIAGAMAPLGREYGRVLSRAFDERWIDWYSTPGKRSGAYNNGAAYDVHPYVLLNYNGSYDAVSTVAHELGHSLHSHFANATQPYPTAGFPIFLAEVASTFNEALLIDHALDTTTDVDVRMSLLGNHLETMRTTLFRQAQFAEFELRMHEMAERGEPITGATLSQLYLEIARRYYGHESAVTVVGDDVAYEWSYVGHFYREFYVYQYATSLCAAEALAERVAGGDEDATRRYLAFLGSGGSDYPIEILRRAGVDMTTGEALDAAMRRMERVMDEMESLLRGRG